MGAAKQFFLDGEPVAVSVLLSVNDFSAEETEQIQALRPGDSLKFGGGAAAVFILSCAKNCTCGDSATAQAAKSGRPGNDVCLRCWALDFAPDRGEA